MSAIQPDVQQQPTQTQEQQTQARKPVVTDRMAALEAITAARHADFEKETGVKIEPFVSVPGEDDDPDAAAAEAERARLEAEAQSGGASARPSGEDDTQRQLQQEQQAAAASKPGLDPKGPR
jgi:hypothetical protein